MEEGWRRRRDAAAGGAGRCRRAASPAHAGAARQSLRSAPRCPPGAPRCPPVPPGAAEAGGQDASPSAEVRPRGLGARGGSAGTRGEVAGGDRGAGTRVGAAGPPPSPCPAPAHPPGGAVGWERGLIQHRAVGTRGCWAGRAVPHGGAELLGGTGVAPGWGHRAGGPCWEQRWPCSGAVIWGAGCGALPISPKFPLQQQQEVSPWLCAVPGTLGTLCHGAAASLLHPAVAVALAPWHPGVLVPVQALGCCESAGAVSQGRVAPLVPGCPRGPGHAGCEGGGPQGSAPGVCTPGMCTPALLRAPGVAQPA